MSKGTPPCFVMDLELSIEYRTGHLVEMEVDAHTSSQTIVVEEVEDVAEDIRGLDPSTGWGSHFRAYGLAQGMR